MEFLGLTWVFIYFLLFSQCSLIIVNGTLTSKSPSVTTVAFFYRQQIKDTTQPRTRMLCSSTLNPYEILHISHLQLFKTLLRCHFCLVHFLKEEKRFLPSPSFFNPFPQHQISCSWLLLCILTASLSYPSHETHCAAKQITLVPHSCTGELQQLCYSQYVGGSTAPRLRDRLLESNHKHFYRSFIIYHFHDPGKLFNHGVSEFPLL